MTAQPIIDLIIDSGAYTAWRSGGSIDIERYCDYLLENQEWIGTYINLDVINPDDPEAAATASFENYLYMRKRGLRPMVVFHAKEEMVWLDRMLDAGADYIGLAGLSLGSHVLRDNWYAHAWERLINGSGEPIVKVHALGDGRFETLGHYPWYSADSTSWIYAAQRTGTIPLENNKSVSHRNDGLNDAGCPDIESLLPADRLVFENILDRMGINPEVFKLRGKESTIIRNYMALLFYLDQERRLSEGYPKTFKRYGLFSAGPLPRCRPEIGVTELKYYSVLGTNAIAWACLAYSGASRGLASYYYLMDMKKSKMGFASFINQKNRLKQYVYDPVEVCISTHPMDYVMTTLEKYVDVK